MARPTRLTAVLAAALLLPGSGLAQDGRVIPDGPRAREAQDPGAPWNARTAEHLWNRAGFGAGREDVARAVAMGRAAFVEELLAGPGPADLPFYSRIERYRKPPAEELSDEERRRRFFDAWRDDFAQLADYLAWWVDRMVDGEDPLRERMTLFWHGHFTTSIEDVKNSHEIILQHQLLRAHALGSFGELVHGIARDPAMLEYLDNDESRKESPNENFARELMELFTLGEGNYTEEDVREVARAFTGWTDTRGRFRIAKRKHDDGEKTVLGVTGPLDGDDVIEILLAQEACPRFLAAKLLLWFEGVEPSNERVEDYARTLRAADLELEPFLRRLFHDPAFYRDEVVGTRIAGPIDFLVGTVRRLGARPPARLLVVGGALLGQKLAAPPNVKGWEEGEAWITTAALLHRANLAGALVGQLELRDFLPLDPYAPADRDAEDSAGMAMAGGDAGEVAAVEAARVRLPSVVGQREMRTLRRLDWRPRLNLTQRLRRLGVRKDADVVRVLADELLAVRLGKETREELVALLRERREEAGLEEKKLLSRPLVAEPILRELAHVVLSLPEAQLH